MLDRSVYPTEEFKKESKYFVFCKINGEHEASLFQQFQGSGFPLLVYLKADGSEVGRVLGYEDTAPLVAEMEKIRIANGL